VVTVRPSRRDRWDHQLHQRLAGPGRVLYAGGGSVGRTV